METAKCNSCQNVNEVKVSTGHTKPENKGRKYFTCSNCKQFQWVEAVDTPASPSQVPQGTKGVDTRPMGERDTPLPDWDAKERISIKQTSWNSVAVITAAMMGMGTDVKWPEIEAMVNSVYDDILSVKKGE